MKKQFFDKNTVRILLLCLGAYLLAVLTWWYPVLSLPVLILALGSTAWITKRNIVIGLGLLFLELIIGGHGLLVNADIGIGVMTLRHAVFVGFFLGYGLLLLEKREVIKPIPALAALVALFIWLAVSFFVGGIENGWMPSFDEFNSYFYLLLLVPILSHDWLHTEKRQILAMVFGGIAYLALTSILFAYAYGHIPGDIMNIPYKIFRDARITEVSLQVVQNPPAGAVQSFMSPWLGEYPYWYRVFNPSHIFFSFAILLYAAYGMRHGMDRSIRKHWLGFTVLVLLALFVGMSRSILLAVLGSGLVLAAVVWYLRGKKDVILIAQTVGVGMITVALSVIAFVTISAIQIPERPDLRDATFYSTSAETTRNAAVTSRWSLLPELHKSIAQAPIFGHGLGKSLTYVSSDPRIVADTGGAYNTYRFEWGYQDMLVKFGILGWILYGYLLWNLFGAAILSIRSRSWIELGALAGVLAVLLAHVFTPYLNHPLGIGIILLAVIIVDERRYEKLFVPVKKENVIMTLPSAAPARFVSRDRA